MTIDLKSIWLCPSCASFHLHKSSLLVCEKCGFQIRKHDYKIIMDYSKYVFQYGYRYRELYENQVANIGEIGPKFCFTDQATIYAFLGVAALSGVVGNLAYDIVKAASKKIIYNFNKLMEEEADIRDDEIEKIFKNFEEFINNFSSIDKKVADAITEEMIVHSVRGKDAKKMAKLIFANERSPKVQAEMVKIMKKAIKKEKKKPKPQPENFDDFWGNIKIQ